MPAQTFRIAGRPLLSNNAVNLVSASATAVLIAALVLRPPVIALVNSEVGSAGGGKKCVRRQTACLVSPRLSHESACVLFGKVWLRGSECCLERQVSVMYLAIGHVFVVSLCA